MTNGNDKAFADRTVTTIYVDGKTESSIATDGLTKREYFAAMAMQGMYREWLTRNENSKRREVARDAVAMADALIEALNKEAK